MFTGIIQELGKIKSIASSKTGKKLTISHSFTDLVLGESIAVDGVCLTVSSFTDKTFTADLLSETFLKTALQYLKTGENVNIERALRPQDRMGGHFVTGHIDEMGKILSIKTGEDIIITIEYNQENSGFIVEKGSVSLSGISLTVVNAQKTTFSVHLIPHTLQQTSLQSVRIGDKINIEYDILAKYVQKSSQIEKSSISSDFLKKHGYF